MPYEKLKFNTIKSKKIETFLEENTSLDLKLTLSLLKSGKIKDENGKILKENQKLKSEQIFITIFNPITKGLKPIFDNFHFAIFDKPSGIKVHPKNSEDLSYTLLDEIKFQFKNANLVNRIDKETSGLVLIAKNEYADFVLKNIFEKREVVKKYLALVDGKINKSQIIDKKIESDKESKIKLKMKTSNSGKDAITKINPIKYFEDKNQTLVEAIPKTGRQHQIRVHLNSINHTIIGDPLYGLDEDISNKILKNELTLDERISYSKKNRLMLHSNYLEFEFLGVTYKIKSNEEFV